MIEIIPLNKEEINLNKIELINIDSSYIFSTSLNIISKLLSYDNYPISKNKAIIKILTFLNGFDTNLNIFDREVFNYHSKTLREYFRDSKQYMDILYQLGIIKKKRYQDGSYYTPNNKSTQYEYFDSYDYDYPCLVVINGNRKMKYIFDNEVDLKYKNTIMRIEIDIKASINDEIDLYLTSKTSIRKLQSRLSTTLNVLSNRSISRSIKTDRIRNSFSNISKVSRKHISYNGKRFYEMDVSTCQPLLLAYFLKSEGLRIDDEYLRDVQSGKVYDIIAEKIGKTREETKLDLYKSIFFLYRPERNKAGKAFLELYNLTAMSINFFMDRTDKTMASILQSLEASIFNKLKVVHSEGYFTLYDAIFFTSVEDIDFLSNQIRDSFSIFNLKVNIDIR